MKDWVLVQGAKLKKMTMKKVAGFTITKMNTALMTNLVKAVGREKAKEMVFNEAAEMGHEFMLELFAQMPKDLERSGGIGKAAWLTFAGKAPSETIFEPIKMGEYEGLMLIIRDDDCVFCEGVAFDSTFCTFPAGAFQGASQTWCELTGHPVKTFVRETKCKAKGDPYCEITQLIVPKEMPIEFLKKERPELFEELDIGFISYD
jgi:hypothetical protein